ncbi:AraC family transcriptional regulator [Massilia arenosa]|uniref:AraC family transcriptional regulator n=1 Tax=Zemynaea arenosa TaxID=2561931 RepID=A0A4Y9SHR8_9BURK|nr:helix-turn-helix domain-containing protein [Massilia arenosa]TFW24501.1 AraC family transcriptional regulator [Massilia arenosa]
MSIEHIVARRRRLRRVLDYVEAHLHEDLTLSILAEVACLSKFHFTSFYREALGETPMATVRRLRLAEGRALLLQGASVCNAALRSRYGSPQTFARAFSREFGLAPTRAGRESAGLNYQVAVVELPTRPVYRVPFADFGTDASAAFDQLLARAETRGIARPAWTVWSRVDAGLGDSLSGACLERFEGMASLRGVVAGSLGGGRHAQVRWRGADRPPPAMLRRIAEQASGHAPVSGQVLCHYLNDPVFTAPHERVVDYYLPLR